MKIGLLDGLTEEEKEYIAIKNSLRRYRVADEKEFYYLRGLDYLIGRDVDQDLKKSLKEFKKLKGCQCEMLSGERKDPVIIDDLIELIEKRLEDQQDWAMSIARDVGYLSG